jgi:ornithine cyclodeaminase
MRFIDREEVAARLTYEAAIPLVREAMIAVSSGKTLQTLRSIIPMADGRLFGVMPGAMGESDVFGAKLISVFPQNFEKGVQSHQGLILLFDPESGAPVCVIHAGEVTAIRTAAASAVATDALARPEAKTLALLGYGEQAATHARAIRKVRPIAAITVWGRSRERAAAFAARMGAELALPVTAASSAAEAVAGADIICAVSGAHDPILFSADVADGTHINLVGSSRAGPAEADNALVARARFIADSREGVLAQGGEFLRAKAAGLVDDAHVAGEIGEVLAGTLEGRRSAGEVTAYKSLGHVAQDLACGWALHGTAI